MLSVIDIQSGVLNVRSGPGAHHGAVGALVKGDLVEIVASDGPWRQIGPEQWVHSDFLRPAAADEAFILPHYRWPDDPDRKLLAGFNTGKADLKMEHVHWLSSYVAQRAILGQWVFLRGYASKIGNAHVNLQLSKRRAQAVREFLVNECSAPLQRITGYGGVGEQWSGGDETDNSPKWRAVEVVVSDGVLLGPAIVFTSDDVGNPLSRNFHIKYLGGGGGGPNVGEHVGFGLSAHGFMIRNPGNWYIRYACGLVSGSVSENLIPLPASFSLGEKLPPGEGWAPFHTDDLRTVDSFRSPAFLLAADAGVGGPLTWNLVFRLMVPGIFQVDVPTGPGLTSDLLGVAVNLGLAWDLVPHPDGPRHGMTWQHV